MAKVELEMTLNKPYEAAYADPKSPAFKKLADEIADEMAEGPGKHIDGYAGYKLETVEDASKSRRRKRDAGGIATTGTVTVKGAQVSADAVAGEVMTAVKDDAAALGASNIKAEPEPEPETTAEPEEKPAPEPTTTPKPAPKPEPTTTAPPPKKKLVNQLSHE